MGEAACSGWAASNPEWARALNARAAALLEAFLTGFERATAWSGARAALTVRAAHWLAHRTGIWNQLDGWERVSLLVAAAGLRCVDSGADDSSPSEWRPQTEHAKALDKLFKILEVVDLPIPAESRPRVHNMIGDLLMRARPRCALEDTHFSRV